MEEEVSLESLYGDNLTPYDRIDQLFDPNAFSTEGCTIIDLPWKENIKFQIERSGQFEIDWKSATGEEFRVNSDLYVSLCTYILKLHNDQFHTYSYANNKTRRFNYTLSSSGVGKRNDARVFFCLYKSNALIFLAAIASQKEHHGDEKDIKAKSRAQTVISKKSATLHEEPV